MRTIVSGAAMAVSFAGGRRAPTLAAPRAGDPAVPARLWSLGAFRRSGVSARLGVHGTAPEQGPPMLLLDTREIPHADQPEAFSAAMEGAATPCRIERRDPDDGLHVRMQVWAGARTTVMSTDATRFRLVRTPRHVRADGQPVIGLSYQAAGRAEFVQRDHQQLVSGPDLM